MAIAAIVFAALLLSGCGASITVYDYMEDGLRYNEYELKIDGDTVTEMEKTAILDPDGRKYTVSDYFQELFSSHGYSITGAEKGEDGAYTARYRKAFTETATPELFATGTTLDFEVYYKDNAFYRLIERKSPNPFNGVRAAFDAAGENPNASATLIQQLKNGRVAVNEFGERVVQFPSVTDAFPYLRGVDPAGLLLNYAQVGSSRMDSSGVSHKLDDNNSKFVFSRYFDDTETTIEYSYKRPVPYGWYLVALAAGGLTVAIFVLATRPKKPPKETLLDRFPYNPEQFRDYESHLPAERK